MLQIPMSAKIPHIHGLSKLFFGFFLTALRNPGTTTRSGRAGIAFTQSDGKQSPYRPPFSIPSFAIVLSGTSSKRSKNKTRGGAGISRTFRQSRQWRVYFQNGLLLFSLVAAGVDVSGFDAW
jgi:hypothetical protein